MEIAELAVSRFVPICTSASYSIHNF